MELSKIQVEALEAVKTWLNNWENKEGNPSQVFKLFGYAGTGKTTLAKYFASQIEGRVMFAAYTGKAALVLQQKGCIGASTIHKLIYHPKDKSKGHLKEMEEELRRLVEKAKLDVETDDDEIFPEEDESLKEEIAQLKEKIEAEKENLKRPLFSLNLESDIQFARLVVIDECSMVDETIGNDLLSFNVPILVLGDPAQLPPVKGCGFFTNSEPDFMLKEIHRQAQGNPIIDMATKVRMGESLSLGSYGTSDVLTKDSPNYSSEAILKADQVIVGRNKTRRDFNRQFRRMLGRKGALPEPGDKLVCLRNNHDLGILNGEIWYCQECVVDGNDSDKLILTITNDNKDTVQLLAHAQPFLGEDINFWEETEAEKFDYGYVLTCHKSQGSQWKNVVVFDESSCFMQSKRNWLYTAITRAEESVKIVV